LKRRYVKQIIQILSVIGLVTLFLGSSASVIAADEVTVVIDAPGEVNGDSDFTADIDVTNLADFDAGQFDISIDTSVLRLDDVSSGLIGSTTIPVSAWNEISSGTYRIVLNVSGIPGVSGSGYLAVLHFHVIGSDGESSAIQISSGFLNNNLAEEITATWNGDSTTVHEEVVITTTSLSIGVVGSAYSATLQATGGSGSYTWTVLSGSLPDGLSLSSAGVISGTPTASGTFYFTVEATDGTLSDSKEYYITIAYMGDADGDGMINTNDITKVERIIVALDDETYNADANQDGNINTADITKVERIIAGMD